MLIAKTHAAPAARALAERATAITITVRDPRDGIVSWMAHNRAPSDLALRGTDTSLLKCVTYAADTCALLLRIEDRIFDRAETIARLTATLPGSLSQADFDRIHVETRRAAIEAFNAGLEAMPRVVSGLDSMTGQADTYDPQAARARSTTGATHSPATIWPASSIACCSRCGAAAMPRRLGK